MTKCTRCGRWLRSPVMVGGKPYGSTCAARVAPPAPKHRPSRVQIVSRRQRVKRSGGWHQFELFAEAQHG